MPLESRKSWTSWERWAAWLSITITLSDKSTLLWNFLKKFSTVSLLVVSAKWKYIPFNCKLIPPIIVILFPRSRDFYITIGKIESLGCQILPLLSHKSVDDSSMKTISFFRFSSLASFEIYSRTNLIYSSSVLEL